MDVIELGTLGSTPINPSDSLSLDFSDIDNSLSSNEDDEDIISFSLDRSTNLSITADASGTENDNFGILFEIVTDDACSLVVGAGVSSGALFQDDLEIFQGDLAPGDYEIIVTPSLNSPPTTTNIEELSTDINYTLNITPTPLEDAPVDDTIATEPPDDSDSTPPPEAPPVENVSNGVYRFFNQDTGVHFYTGNETERDTVLELPNFSFEGASYQSIDPLTGNPEPAPVYRFLNQDTGVHLYTISEVERDATQELDNFSFEGEAFFAYPAEVDGSIPIYRFFNTTSGAHFYTPSAAERDNVEANLPDFQSEGIAYYALPIEE